MFDELAAFSFGAMFSKSARGMGGFALKQRLAFRAASIAVVLLATVAIAPSQQAKASEQPLTAEQLAVYRATLSRWMEQELSTINLSFQTVLLQTSGASSDEECATGLNLEPASEVVHRFRTQDLQQLGSDKIRLVDPDLQRQEVAENDPERSIGKGKTVEEAVSNGFAHGLVTLSEIRFDKEHKLAIVSYSFFCGSLCGNGGTVVMEKTDAGWRRKSRCHSWIS